MKPETKKLTPEAQNRLNILKRHFEQLKPYHPGDDSVFAYTYGGYTVRESRSQIRQRISWLKAQDKNYMDEKEA